MNDSFTPKAKVGGREGGRWPLSYSQMGSETARSPCLSPRGAAAELRLGVLPSSAPHFLPAP